MPKNCRFDVGIRKEGTTSYDRADIEYYAVISNTKRKIMEYQY
jgi:hypothetical protein